MTEEQKKSFMYLSRSGSEIPTSYLLQRLMMAVLPSLSIIVLETKGLKKSKCLFYAVVIRMKLIGQQRRIPRRCITSPPHTRHLQLLDK